jgi:hypothetical protein
MLYLDLSVGQERLVFAIIGTVLLFGTTLMAGLVAYARYRSWESTEQPGAKLKDVPRNLLCVTPQVSCDQQSVPAAIVAKDQELEGPVRAGPPEASRV